MAGRMERNPCLAQFPPFAIPFRFQINLFPQSGPKDRFARCFGKIAFAPGARMIAVAMRNDCCIDGAPRIDKEIARRTVQARIL